MRFIITAVLDENLKMFGFAFRLKKAKTEGTGRESENGKSELILCITNNNRRHFADGEMFGVDFLLAEVHFFPIVTPDSGRVCGANGACVTCSASSEMKRWRQVANYF